jgi:membrane-bound inhibitor of C-type lysozyme
VSLTKVSGAESRYTSGVIALVINGAETTLNDGEKIAYTGCKPQLTK